MIDGPCSSTLPVNTGSVDKVSVSTRRVGKKHNCSIRSWTQQKSLQIKFSQEKGRLQRTELNQKALHANASSMWAVNAGRVQPPVSTTRECGPSGSPLRCKNRPKQRDKRELIKFSDETLITHPTNSSIDAVEIWRCSAC